MSSDVGIDYGQTPVRKDISSPDADRWADDGGRIVTAEDFETMLEVDIALINWFNRHDSRDIATPREEASSPVGSGA